MLQRHIKYVYKEGIYSFYDGENVVEYVGGSPLIIFGQSQFTLPSGPPYDYSLGPDVYVNGAFIGTGEAGIDVLPKFLGVAVHSRKVDSYIRRVAVIKRPAIITVFKGKAGMKEFQQAEEYYPFGFTEDDAFHPVYLEPNEILNVGDLMIPYMITEGNVRRSVWVRATYQRLGLTAGIVVPVPARVQAVSGTGEDLLVVLELGNFNFEVLV